MKYAMSLLLAGGPLLVIEILSRILKLKGEFSRKATHVLSAVMVCFLPRLIPLRHIAFVAAFFLVILLATRGAKLWKSLYGITRTSYGELWYPLGIGLAALLAEDSRQFIAAVLIMGISDTLAALIGQRYGKKLVRIKSSKSLEGSLTFLLSSILILCLVLPQLSLGMALLFGVILTIVEYVSLKGSDNLTVPLVCIWLTSTGMRLLA